MEVARRAEIQPASVRAERLRRGIGPFQPRRDPVEWTEERIVLLGTDSDANIAALLGISKRSVQAKRWALGIPPFYPHRGAPQGHLWTRQELALLGRASDRKVGERVGLTAASVQRKRQRLGIPPWRPPAPRIRWTKRMLSNLGRVTDYEFGRKFGVSRPRVRAKRAELGIPARFEKRPVERTATLRKLLRMPSSMVRRATGLKFDTIADLRRELGVPAPTIGEWCWPPRVIKRLGTVPDRELAPQVGVSAARVGGKRRQLGIPPFRAWRAWKPREVAQLGKLPDDVVAARLGRPVSTVTKKRQELERLARGAHDKRLRDRPRKARVPKRR